MWDDLSYGLNTLGPLCLWQCLYLENCVSLCWDTLANGDLNVTRLVLLALDNNRQWQPGQLPHNIIMGKSKTTTVAVVILSS